MGAALVAVLAQHGGAGGVVCVQGGFCAGRCRRGGACVGSACSQVGFEQALGAAVVLVAVGGRAAPCRGGRCDAPLGVVLQGLAAQAGERAAGVAGIVLCGGLAGVAACCLVGVAVALQAVGAAGGLFGALLCGGACQGMEGVVGPGVGG